MQAVYIAKRLTGVLDIDHCLWLLYHRILKTGPFMS